ncbi:MAG: hypothetical protein N2712_03590 [Brevinematales bacterium]|nr:hypothetical protein [Brevinematales bacterium]
MWLSKLLDILGALLYIFLLFVGIRLGFKNSFAVSLIITLTTIFNTIIFRIFKNFIVKEYLGSIDVAVVMLSSVIGVFLTWPLIVRIYEKLKDIEIVIVSKMVGFLLFSINGIMLIGYFVIFTDILPQLHYILETSNFLRIMSNIVKFILGIEIT